MRKELVLDTKKIKTMTWGKQQEMAAKMGIAKGSLSRKINGLQIFDIKEINFLASIIGVDTIELMKQVYIDPDDEIKKAALKAAA
ncbi:helix-turn-helix transcriptional regulator [Candidatus Poribacteria bacterium]|nr:helix-turn-helix transcriptional regulator [Candidatus Poribacteria bacterium]